LQKKKAKVPSKANIASPCAIDERPKRSALKNDNPRTKAPQSGSGGVLVYVVIEASYLIANIDYIINIYK